MQSFVTILAVVVWTMLGFYVGKMSGIAEGHSMALKTNPVSEELDAVCAGLWISEQNREAIKRGVVK
jgi:hypothetical protein